MTIRSVFNTSTLAAVFAGSLTLLAAGGGAHAGSGFRGFHHYQPPIARIPTGPYKPITPHPCSPLPHTPCGWTPVGH
jgi:hypothetical protein